MNGKTEHEIAEAGALIYTVVGRHLSSCRAERVEARSRANLAEGLTEASTPK